jgi:hypothetical protein
MLAEHDHFPRRLPPGFSFVDGEPEFIPERHLALDGPQEVVTLADLGYRPEEIRQFPSPIAIATPLRILSDEGIQALQNAIELTMPRTVRTANGDPRLYFGTYHSRFMRDLSFSPVVTDALSEIFKSPIAPHTMGHLGVQIVMGTQPQVEIEPWHHDRVSFTVVLTMYDPAETAGGRFQYFVGTRDEARLLMEDNPELPADRVASPECPLGSAVLMQGPAVCHRGATLQSAGYRASFVISYCHRDARYPDLNDNRSYFTDDTADRLGLDSDINPSYLEWARHNAWYARARLGTLIEELPWTNDRAAIAEQLRQAIEPVQVAIVKLEREVIPRSRGRADQRQEDQDQMNAPLFDPGTAASAPEGNPG